MADATQSSLIALPVSRPSRPTVQLLKRVRREPAVCAGSILVAFILLAAASAPLVSHILGHGPAQQFGDTALDEMGMPIGPSLQFPLGADGNGRDVW